MDLHRLPPCERRDRIVDHADDGRTGESGNGGETVGDSQQNAGVLWSNVQVVAVEPGKIGAVETFCRGEDMLTGSYCISATTQIQVQNCNSQSIASSTCILYSLALSK